MKTMMQNKFYKIAALFLVAAMSLGTAVPYMAAPEDNRIYISSAKDLVQLSENCRYDKWSVGKTVILSNNISLSGVEFEPIPYFAGTFDGQGYTISDFELGGSFYPGALFGTTEQGALIYDLNVTGSIMPEGDKEAVGGIVGINGGTLRNVSFSGVVSGEVAVGGIVGLNESTGIIENAYAQGSIFGEHGTGGIVGRNLGVVMNCRNEASVNNTSDDSTVSLEDLDTNFLQNLYAMNSSEVMNSFTDSGGIAGFSSGMVVECENSGTIGYPRVGYNAGGIVGRSCGYIQGCINDGEVLGRKDIGGIVGQVEPFIEEEVSESDLAIIDAQIETLQSQVNHATNTVENTINSVDENLDSISNYVKDTTVEGLSDSINNINNEAQDINKKVENGTSELGNDLESINNQVGAISDSVETMSNNVKNFTLDDVISDTSGVDIDSVVHGKIKECSNEGRVSGDLNVGGITGIMSMEYEVDPEDDTSMDISWEERKQYEVKAILEECTNRGEVVAQKENVGAICGRMDIGMITKCFAYGSATSEAGNYVGGIAGLAYTTVRNCVAKCGLTGNSYVGGIIGCGYIDDEEGESMVSNCLSLVEITDCEQFEGAIAGCEDGSFEDNYFVSNVLQGINRVNYEGAAQQITYEEMLQISGIPDELKHFTLKFVAEDRVIKSVDFNYGDSFGEEVIPEVPEKDGSDGVWEITDLSNLCFDTVVTAEYTPYVTAIRADITRGNTRPILLVEGNFSANDTLTLAAMNVTKEIQEQLGMSGKVIEVWNVSFSDDGHKRHNIRFLPAEGMSNTKLYVKENDEWTRVETTEIGSYQSFQVVGNEIELAVVSRTAEIVFFVGLAIVAVAVVVVLILLEKKKHIFSNLVRMEKEKHLFSNFIKKIGQKIGVKKLIIAISIVGILAGIVLVAYVTMIPKVRVSAELAALTKDVITAENQSMKLNLSADIRSNHIELNSNMYAIKQGDSTVVVLEENENAIYLDGNTIYLENGKAFLLGEEGERDTPLLELIRKLFESAEITRIEELDNVIYSITATGEDAENLLTMLVPSSEGQIASAGYTQIRIIASNGIFQRVEIKGTANIKDSMETNIDVFATIYDFKELRDGEYQLPLAVVDAMENAENASLSVMEEEWYRLLIAWIQFDGKERDGKVTLDVECGPINMKKDCDWADVSKGIASISNAQNIEKIPNMIYGICMNGDYSYEKLGDSYIFKVSLDEEAMSNLAKTIAPEILAQTVTYTDGLVEVVVENNQISSFKIVINGDVKAIISKVNASVEAEFIFD